MQPVEIHEKIQNTFGADVAVFKPELIDPAIEIQPEKILEVCRFLRDDGDLKFDFLRSLSGVDLNDAFEVVYHLYSYAKRHYLVVKTRMNREEPSVDSVAGVWPTANWHERETYDLFGIDFKGHPKLTRLFMPEDWVGYPMRKDYVNPTEYHGIPCTREEGAPVTRHEVEGHPTVQQAMHEKKCPETMGFMRLNMGPHHPATHGVLNLLLETDGEILKRAVPDVGYLHRGIEKLAEDNAYIGTMPYTDRIDYLGAMFGNHAWALAVEKLAGIETPPRAEYCRIIASELNRIASHLIGTGTVSMDLGAFTPFVHWLRERETINDIMEFICGSRLTYNYMRFGGVARDIEQSTVDMILRWLDHFEPMIDEFNRLISGNEIFIKRLAHVGVISPEEAAAHGLVGPNLRASGVNFDIRRDEPYSIYPDLKFDVIVGEGFEGEVGDSFDRFYCRVLEIRESVRLVRQACEAMPAGDIQGKVKKVLKPEANEVYARVESARGEMGMYVISDGSDKPYRMKTRTGSYTAMAVMEHLSPGLLIADLVAVFGSLDIVAPEVDR